MSDSTNIIANQIGVSSECLFKMKASAAPSRSVKCNVIASNAANFVGGTSIFNIPSERRATFLDQSGLYLKFCVLNNDPLIGNGVYVDNSAYSFINRIDILQGSQQLETLQAINVYNNYVCDMQLTPSSKCGLSSYGFMNQILPGRGRQGQIINGTQKISFCLPLLGSALLNNLDTMIPLHSLSDDIIVQITWESNNAAVCYNLAANASTWSILSPELVFNIVEMQDLALSIVNDITPLNQPIYLHGSTIKHTIGNIPALSQGTFTFPLPFRFFSIRNIIALPRRADSIVNPIAYSISSRINPNWSSYNLRIGSYMYPQRPIRLWSAVANVGGYAEALTENIRSFHSLSSLIGTGLTVNEFNVADSVDLTTGVRAAPITIDVATGNLTYLNGFSTAIELETYSNRNSVILSGMNCVSTNIFFEGEYSAAIGANAYTVDFYCNHDIVFIIQDGLITTKY